MTTASKLAKAAGLAIGATAVVAARDVTQKRHAILRTYPIIGHLRFFLERFGPELRQYIVTGNDEERPFSRDQRRWIYASAKLENNYFGFGTDNDVEHANGYPILKHRTFKGEGAPAARHAGDEVSLPSAKVLGGPRGRRHAFRPDVVVNISGMSFGSLSRNAIEALNRGAQLAGCLHDTGEGALSPYHRSGGDLVFQIGTSYFGCRDEHGQFELARLKDLCAGAPVRAIEIKLSQGAKPGLGGMLPGAKVTQEIAEIRGIQPGVTAPRPAGTRRSTTSTRCSTSSSWWRPRPGSPVGIKSAVGSMGIWDELIEAMAGRQPWGRLRQHRRRRGRHRRRAADLRGRRGVPVPGRVRRRSTPSSPRPASPTTSPSSAPASSGSPRTPSSRSRSGVDMVNVGREAMMSIGCIQAQKCHTDHCPTGVATQNPWLVRGLDPELKSVRAANYIKSLRRDL